MIGFLRVTSYFFRDFKISNDKRKLTFSESGILNHVRLLFQDCFIKLKPSRKQQISLLTSVQVPRTVSEEVDISRHFFFRKGHDVMVTPNIVVCVKMFFPFAFELWRVIQVLSEKNNASDFTDESRNSETGNTNIIRSNFKVYYSSKYFRCFEMPRFKLIVKALPVDWNQ